MRIRTKYAGKCDECGTEIPQGNQAEWHRTGRLTCLGCWLEGPVDPPHQDFPDDNGIAIWSGDDEPPEPCDYCHAAPCRCNSEYAKGVADANAYLDNKRFLGEEEANRLAVEDEIRRGGEW